MFRTLALKLKFFPTLYINNYVLYDFIMTSILNFFSLVYAGAGSGYGDGKHVFSFVMLLL